MLSQSESFSHIPHILTLDITPTKKKQQQKKQQKNKKTWSQVKDSLKVLNTLFKREHAVKINEKGDGQCNVLWVLVMGRIRSDK